MAAWNFVTTNGGTYPQGYDDEDRFVHFAQAGQSKTFNFTRSDIGNITNINLNGSGTTRGFNNIHALTSIETPLIKTQVFNTDGNLTTSHAGHANTWDEAGMMKQSVVPTGSAFGIAGTNEYGYDADRKRVYKKITRNGSVAEHSVFVHAGPNLIAQYPAGTAAASPTQEYVYAQEIDSLVMLVRNSGNEKLTITRNQQWSVTALSDSANGSVLERYTYDYFGKRTILEPNGTTVRATSSYNMPFGYTSREHDAETGLMYFRARYYDPHTAEFTSPDPLEYVDGMSLFRGYFVLNGVDINGTFSQKLNQDDEPGGFCESYWVRKNVITIEIDFPSTTLPEIFIHDARVLLIEELTKRFGELDQYHEGSDPECPNGCKCCVTQIVQYIYRKQRGPTTIHLKGKVVKFLWSITYMHEHKTGSCISKDDPCPEPTITIIRGGRDPVVIEPKEVDPFGGFGH